MVSYDLYKTGSIQGGPADLVGANRSSVTKPSETNYDRVYTGPCSERC